MTAPDDVARALATFATGSAAADNAMTRFVRFSLKDWMTVGVAGRDEPVVRAARSLSSGRDGAATMFGGGRTDPRTAALVNGAASHALDYDDTHFGHIGHPSVAVMPAALAVAEAHGADGAAFLDALAVGLETACRVGDWLGRGHYDAGFHQTGTAGAFGAAAAAGRLLGLDTERMADALRLTATRAGGLKSQFGTMGKPLNAGFAAEAGVACALLAGAGATSAPGALDGAQGFGPTHAGEARGGAFAALGETWIFPRVSYKFHACCHGLHAMLEALRTLRAAGVEGADVEAVTVTTHPRWLAVCNQPEPSTGLAAKFSYRLTAAMALLDIDTAALGSYSAETCARADACALRDRVVVRTDAGMTDTGVHVALSVDGRVHEVRHDLLHPVDAAVIDARLSDKFAALLGPDAADTLCAAVDTLRDAPDLSAVAGMVGIPRSS